MELALDAFERSGTARVRPEGSDDLEIEYPIAAAREREHVQIKKPRQTQTGERNVKPWRLLEICDDLLWPAFERLLKNSDKQVWILGDELDEAGKALTDAGPNSPREAPGVYSIAVYRLARHRSGLLDQVDSSVRGRLVGWTPAAPPPGADHTAWLSGQVQAASARFGLDQSLVDQMIKELELVNDELPSVLARITARPSYGEIDELRERAATRLASRFQIDEQVARRTVLNNFRGFLDDIARQRTRWIVFSDFELELLRVLPHTIPFASAPDLPRFHVARPHVIEGWTSGDFSVTSVVASSGAGKSTAAGELVATLLRKNPDEAVFYAELRKEHDIRDFLLGLGFKLRRRGHANAFTVATRLGVGEQALIDSFAEALLSVTEPVQVIVDFVQGSGQPEFHALLAELVRRLGGRGPRMYLFAHQDPVEALNPIERTGLGVRRVDVLGLHETELVDLGKLHGHGDEAALRKLHTLLSAGRYGGVLPRDAVALLRLGSTDAMLTVVQTAGSAGAGEAADRSRFHGLYDHIRECASRLLCFSLPFTVDDAQEAFPALPVRATMLRLHELGLLLPHRPGLFEFHERVRAGLLNESRPDLVKEAHARLAELTAAAGSHAAAVYHYEQAGQSTRAVEYARRVVLTASRSGLLEYARRHALFEADELVPAASPSSAQWWTALHLLEDVGDEHSADQLIEMIRSTDGLEHYSWLLKAQGTTLRLAPRAFDELFEHAASLDEAVTSHQPFVKALLLSARRVDFDPPESVDDRFEANPDQRPQLLPFLALRSTAGRMRAFVEFVHGGGTPSDSDFLSEDGARRHFVAALPELNVGKLVAAHDFNLGPFGPILWRYRSELRETANAILAAGSSDPATLRSALRLLIYYGDGVTQYQGRFDETTDMLARLGPVLTGDHSILPAERARALDQTRSSADRMLALTVCSLADDPDLESLVDSIAAAGTDGGSSLLALLGVMGPLLPFDFLVRLCAREFASASPTRKFLAGVVAVRLEEHGQVPAHSPPVDLMLKMLGDEDRNLQKCACMGLRRHRLRRALPALETRLGQTHPGELTGGLVSTLLASYPDSAPEITWPPDTDYWRATVADRVRNVGDIPWLISLAVDRTARWQARRAAVCALEQLADAETFEKVAEAVLAEPMLLEMDDGHASATEFFLELLEKERTYDRLSSTQDRIAKGRAAFAELFGDLYRELAQPVLGFRLNDIGRAAAELQWDFVTTGPEGLARRLDLLINQLGATLVQAATMQGLRRLSRVRLLEQTASQTPYPWLAVRACVERRACKPAPSQEWLEEARARTFDVDRQAESAVRTVLHGIDPTMPSAPAGGAVAAKRSAGSATAAEPSLGNYTTNELIEKLERDYEFPASACVIELAATDAASDIKRLAVVLHPANDRVVRFEATDRVSLAPSFDGDRLRVSGVRSRTLVDRRPWRQWLRVALVVATGGEGIPWFSAVESERDYGRMLTECLLARGDGRRAAELLERSERYFDRGIRQKDFAYQLAPILDAQVVPLIERYLWRGSVHDLTGLVRLASKLDFPEIVPCLEVMLQRVTDLIAPRAALGRSLPVGDPAFMSLASLLASPRLPEVRGVAGSLGRLRRALRNGWMLSSVVRAMRRIPQCYADLEEERMTVLNFRHMHVDEFELVSAAAAYLFDRGRPSG